MDAQSILNVIRSGDYFSACVKASRMTALDAANLAEILTDGDTAKLASVVFRISDDIKLSKQLNRPDDSPMSATKLSHARDMLNIAIGRPDKSRAQP